jgi:hypothetical protein
MRLELEDVGGEDVQCDLAFGVVVHEGADAVQRQGDYRP